MSSFPFYLSRKHGQAYFRLLKFLLPLVLGLFLAWSPLAKAKAPADTAEPVKKALVLLTFGTTYDQSADPLALIRKEISARHPDLSLHVAYSSAHVLKILRGKGQPARNLVQVLADLSAEGYSQAAVQSLHVIPGLEFEIAEDAVSRFNNLPKGLGKVTLGLPLISSHADAAHVAEALLKSLPAEYKKDDAVVFVGHGAANPTGSLAYPALQAFLSALDPKAFVGTIEGPFDAGSVLGRLQAAKVKTVWLVPLLTVVGDHAVNDIFGEEEDSWTKIFTKAGLKVVPVKKGLGELQSLAAIWADHADKALE